MCLFPFSIPSSLKNKHKTKTHKPVFSEGDCFPGNESLPSSQLGCCVYLLALCISSCLAALSTAACHGWRMRSFPFFRMSLKVVLSFFVPLEEIPRRRGRSLSHPLEGFFKSGALRRLLSCSLFSHHSEAAAFTICDPLSVAGVAASCGDCGPALSWRLWSLPWECDGPQLSLVPKSWALSAATFVFGGNQRCIPDARV